MSTHAYPDTKSLLLAHVELGFRVTKCQWQENCPDPPYRMFNVGLRAIHAKYAREVWEEVS